jgi:hypothetical protein
MSKITLGNAPGGAVLIEELTKAVADMGLVYAGTPDERAELSLQDFATRIESTLVDAVGATAATKILEAFCAAVRGRKREIESKGAGCA